MFHSCIVSLDKSVFDGLDTFPRRHIGPEDHELPQMLKVVGVNSLQDLVNKTVPPSIHVKNPTRLGQGITETQVLVKLKELGSQNKILKSYIGLGYANSITPPVILRNVIENPQWYTQVS